MTDNHFNNLIKSYRDNYIQWRTTDDPKYQTSYAASEKGIQNMICSKQKGLEGKKKSINDLYKSKIDNHLSNLKAQKDFLGGDLAHEKDLKIAAQERQQSLTTTTPTPSPDMTWYYVTIGVLVAGIVSVPFLPI